MLNEPEMRARRLRARHRPRLLPPALAWAAVLAALGVVGLLGGAVTVRPTPVAAATTVLAPTKDNTLYQDPTGAVSNGAGTYLFAGRTNSGSIRRGLLAFDIAATVPANATITSATLRLTLSRTIGQAETIELHRALADWGEGASNAGTNEGQGGPVARGRRHVAAPLLRHDAVGHARRRLLADRECRRLGWNCRLIRLERRQQSSLTYSRGSTIRLPTPAGSSRATRPRPRRPNASIRRSTRRSRRARCSRLSSRPRTRRPARRRRSLPRPRRTARSAQRLRRSPSARCCLSRRFSPAPTSASASTRRACRFFAGRAPRCGRTAAPIPDRRSAGPRGRRPTSRSQTTSRSLPAR